MKSIVSVNPFDCRLWDLHDRLEGALTEESCKAEIESFAKHGQLIPALGRQLPRDSSHKIELICGARRLFVARHINVPLLVELREMSDREAIIAMDIENQQRTDISTYERGLSYARWLRSGHFRSQEDIAHTLKVSASQVSRLLRFAQLPAVIIDAFENPATICEGWGLEILKLLDDPASRQATISAARSISAATTRPPPREVYRRLVSPVRNGKRLRKQAHDEVVKDEAGRSLYRIRQQANSIAFLLPLNKMAPDVLDDLRQLVSGVLQRPLQDSNGGGTARSEPFVIVDSLVEVGGAERRPWLTATTRRRVASVA
jgi:ParB family transcriptional regulator, chromosome partitioning protein